MPRKKPKCRRERGTGTIFYDSRKGRYSGRVIVGRRPDGTPQYAHRTARTQAALVAKLAAAGPAAADCTVRDWAARWLASSRVRPRTRDMRSVSVRHYVNPTLGHLKVRELTAGQVEAAAAGWGETRAPNTVRLALAHLRTMMQAAADAGLRAGNPVAAARKPRAARRRIDPFTPAEVARIIREAGRRAATRIVALLAGTGCRVGEAMALDAHEFDAGKGTVSISRTQSQAHGAGPTKSERGVRTVRVPRQALPAVVAAHAGRTAGPLFPNAHGNRTSHFNARDNWVKLLKRLGLPYRSLHQLRHSYATSAIAAGVPLADVAAALGDTVESVVRTYTHATGLDVTGVMEGLYGGRKVAGRR